MAKAKVNQGTIIAIQASVIAVLITGVIAFVAGMHYKSTQVTAINSAVSSATIAPTVKK